MIRVCKFTKQSKTRTPRRVRKEIGQCKWIALLHSWMFRLFGKNHCWVDIPKYEWKLLNGWHIVKGKVVEYDYHSKYGKSKTIKIEKILL